tara:strand:+ start:21 stop:461 length:441 start_codon:yes stop_codon:yes gene_type:complete
MQAALTPLALAFGAATPIAQGFMQRSQQRAEAEQAEVNSFIGRTRAIQTDQAARRGLNEELGTLRAALGVNQESPSVGTFEIMQELRDTRDRERRIEVGNRMLESRDFGRQAQNLRARGSASLFGGFLRAGPSLFDLADYNNRNSG